MHKNVRLPIAYHVIGHPDIRPWHDDRLTQFASKTNDLFSAFCL